MLLLLLQQGKMGSLRDPRKLNSVISKANEALVIIGNCFLFLQFFLWDWS